MKLDDVLEDPIAENLIPTLNKIKNFEFGKLKVLDLEKSDETL